MSNAFDLAETVSIKRNLVTDAILHLLEFAVGIEEQDASIAEGKLPTRDTYHCRRFAELPRPGRK